MSDVLDSLVDLLSLERLEQDLFRGRTQDLGWGTVYGGHVVGQALSAADQTVPAERAVHSLHAYSLLPGDVDRPIVYDVDRIRNGNSFTTRRVTAIQNGEAIFNLSASFHVEEEGFDHQDEMPDVPEPDELLSQTELARRADLDLPELIEDRLTAETPIEIRPTEPTNYIDPEPREPTSAWWYRTRGELPDDPSLHRYLLAYASDFNFLSTSMYPHGVSWLTPTMQVASLDHSMWFHRSFRADDWLLHSVRSPTASGARGLVRGKLFDAEGHYVGTTAQEGLIRDHS